MASIWGTAVIKDASRDPEEEFSRIWLAAGQPWARTRKQTHDVHAAEAKGMDERQDAMRRPLRQAMAAGVSLFASAARRGARYASHGKK
ncbi:hypothetical protein HJFPF1_00706 [Paramyrothecium foliicola]|nr:hypothetical protein HJFPF1_00706 [Paramyrothecium foliicola]